jgi:hypothetical protein
MLMEPTYKGIFYDVSKQKDAFNSMQSSMGRKLYHNLTDGMDGKEVWLDGKLYSIKEVRTFHILNTIENTFYAVVDVEIKK